MKEVLFSRKTDDWETPKEIYDFYLEKGFCDPCPFQSKTDNLKNDYSGDLFINPPYSKIFDWVVFAINTHRKHRKNIVLLVPSRTDTKWFSELLKYGCDFHFFKGRLKFGNSKNSAPFPSVLITLKGDGTNSISR